jgi:hypothetical protein
VNKWDYLGLVSNEAAQNAIAKEALTKSPFVSTHGAPEVVEEFLETTNPTPEPDPEPRRCKLSGTIKFENRCETHCYYKCNGRQVEKTVGAGKSCPKSIKNTYIKNIH